MAAGTGFRLKAVAAVWLTRNQNSDKNSNPISWKARPIMSRSPLLSRDRDPLHSSTVNIKAISNPASRFPAHLRKIEEGPHPRLVQPTCIPCMAQPDAKMKGTARDSYVQTRRRLLNELGTEPQKQGRYRGAVRISTITRKDHIARSNRPRRDCYEHR